MRTIPFFALMLLLSASPAVAAVEAEGGPVNLLEPHGGLMFWTLLIFLVLFFVLWKYAFGPITAAVEQRERTLAAALADAKRDREEAAKLLADHKAQMEQARAEAQRLIAEGRTIGEKMRTDMLAETRLQQQELLERARRDIAAERDSAIAQLRREAVELAIAGAGRVIEKNLDSAQNRRLVEEFLAGLDAKTVRT